MRSNFLSLFATLAIASVATSATPIRFPNDAPLRAVYFGDRNEGWAAGDEGVIWHTIDGGTNWERQATGVQASLRSICFLNPFTGYVVGRQELPHGGSAGVILYTSNGGLTWSQFAPNTLPGLHVVKFFSDKLGIVAGDGSDQYGSGVFCTEDGGHTWKIVAGPRQPGWLTADFTDPKTGALAGTWSSLAILRDSVFGKSDIDTLGGRNILCLRIFGQHAMAVGQGGLILSSKDTGGAKWGYITPKQISTETLSSCDFHALSLLGEHAWVAGRPGSIVLHTADYGKTWETQKTGQNVPLNAIHFIDPRVGWAVGELGTILTTEDGGQTWKVQRRGGQRAAVMFIQASEKNLPLESIVQLGADEGYLCTAIRVTCADPASAPLSRANDAQRFSEGLRLAGGAAGESLWQFPLAAHQTELEAKDMLGSWDRLHGQKAKETLLRQLVLAIRT
ncbi:MAG TPA: YCF48-related protein, partial [Gemmataceae bacterium]|nr:YCF48-related protein [Gemmataceae bacterium]